jgi:hypothetical protein
VGRLHSGGALLAIFHKSRLRSVKKELGLRPCSTHGSMHLWKLSTWRRQIIVSLRKGAASNPVNHISAHPGKAPAPMVSLCCCPVRVKIALRPLQPLQQRWVAQHKEWLSGGHRLSQPGTNLLPPHRHSPAHHLRHQAMISARRRPIIVGTRS